MDYTACLVPSFVLKARLHSFEGVFFLDDKLNTARVVFWTAEATTDRRFSRQAMPASSIQPILSSTSATCLRIKGTPIIPRNIVSPLRALPQPHFGGERCALTTSVIATTVVEALEDIDQAVLDGADIVELRIDFLKNLHAARDLQVLLKACPVPCIVTYRPSWEGGQYEGDEEPRIAALWTAVELGAAYVDCELLAADRFFAAAQDNVRRNTSATKIIISSHDYETVPSEKKLAEIHSRCVAAGADIVKIAAMVKDITEVARLEKLLIDSKSSPVEATIVLGMGEAGQVSRLLAAKFGSFLTFGALRSGTESAPGQPTLGQLRDMYRIPKQCPGTKVFGVIGKPVAHSKSPALHNQSFEATGFDACYVPLLVNDLSAFLASPLFGGDSFAGFSVTIPHKEDALACCAVVDPIAKKIGAVNTLVRQPDGTLKGYNTDYSAAIEVIERAYELHLGCERTGTESILCGKTVVVVGAGGAGRGLAFGAVFRGAGKVIVANRNLERARTLAQACGGEAVALSELQSGSVKGDILANTTSLGMYPDSVDDTPMPKEAIRAGGFKVVFDAVYNPLETRLLREAKECGCAQASGLDMFVGQAAQQFELFTGKKARIDVMRRTVLNNM